MDLDSNVNTEMNDLVQHAEEWAAPRGLNRMPTVSMRELETHRIGRRIVTRAAFMLLEKMGIKSVEEYLCRFGGAVEEKEHEKPMSPVSPMGTEEFQSILKNGWPGLEEPLASSPFGSRRRTSMLADLIPLSPIASEANELSPKKFKMPKVMPKRSEGRKLFTSTPRQKEPVRRAQSMPGSALKREALMMTTPQKSTSTTRLDRNSPFPAEGETPLENRASRLRRLKLEENRRRSSIGGNSSMNSSFGGK